VSLIWRVTFVWSDGLSVKTPVVAEPDFMVLRTMLMWLRKP